MRKTILCLSSIALSSLMYGQVENDTIQLEEIVIKSQTVFPDKKINQQASSHVYINKKELEKYNYSDVSRVVAGKAGVHVVEEDGFGLRPNIIIRGASSYRSQKVNLMEDGILIAPAPYVAPAAYYFPSIGRMSGVEILKSSGQIHQGPNTIGGTFNMISTQVPNSLKMKLNTSYGSFDTYKTHAMAGDKIGKFGYMVEYYGNNSRGFKKLPNNKNTGYNINDGVVKLLYDNSDASIPNKLQFKFQISGEKSNETYMGLTREDFKKDAYQRYISSELDNMDNNHRQFILSYQIKPTKDLNINIDLYRNDFTRNWYKVNNVKAGGDKMSLSKVLAGKSNSDEIKALKGQYAGDNTIYVRNNFRDYYSQGLQLNAQYKIVENGNLRFGTRYHMDQQDRFQSDDKYRSLSTGLSLTSKGAPGSQSNRVDDAKALASYLQYQHDFGDLVATIGVRHENIDLERKDYGKKDPNRESPDYKNPKNKINVWIPGASLLYKVSGNANIFASVHKGFSPPGFKNEQEEESSINYELGGRYFDNYIDAELIGYMNDYSNMLGADVNAVGGQSGTGDLFNAGEVSITGLEAQLRYTVNGKNSELRFPIGFTYSYLTSEFKKDFESVVYRGKVKKGDELPYIPNHQFNLEAGVESGKFAFNAAYKYRGDFRSKPGQGEIPERTLIPAVGIMDVSASYYLNTNVRAFVTAQNIFNKEYLSSLTPMGLRPGMPRYVSLGLNVSL